MSPSASTHRRWLSALLLIACFGAGLVPSASSQTKRLDEIRDRQERLENKDDALASRERKIDRKIGVLDRRRARVEAAVAELDAEIAKLDERIERTEVALTEKQQELNALEEELLRVQGRLVARTDLFTARAVAAYKAGPTAYLDSMLSSESFSDLVDRYAYYESALDADSELLEQIENLRDKTERDRRIVEETKNEIAAHKVELEGDRTEVATHRAAKAEVLVARRAVVAEKRALLAGIRNSRRRIAAVAAQLRSESAQLQSLLAQPTAGPLPTGGGQLLWPAAGPLTSPYGNRTHPIFGDTRLHAGIDIGAPYGAPVIAADAGRVVYVGAMSGYGNVVVIDHGGGLGTTYNHLSAFSVSSGQTVSRGQGIASVGCTGYCTGPHLHFEVRINGSPVDPMPYLQ